MKIIFLGSNEFSVKVLNFLIDGKYDIVAVITQPDKPSGRGKKMHMPELKSYALANQIPVYQFPKIRSQASIEEIGKLKPDLMITASYGQILTKQVLSIPKHGVVNVHTSMLPKYRGPAPVQWALINGETETGITIMKTDEGVDTGNIIMQKQISIQDDFNSEQLLDIMAKEAGPLLIKTLDVIEKGELITFEQDEKEATYYPMLKKEMGKIDWSNESYKIENLVRGMFNWPVAYTYLDGEILKIFRAKAIKSKHIQLEKTGNNSNGEVVVANPKQGLIIKCGKGFIQIDSLQVPGKKIMDAKSFINGKKISVGKILK